jgi:uncharacterized damage-inducible protein DinB
MTRQQFVPYWEHLRQSFGIGVRCVEALPADQLDSHPIPGMRTPRALVLHMFTMVRGCAEGVASGEIPAYTGGEENADVKTHADLVRLAAESCRMADRAASSLADSHLAAMVKTPWGFAMPGFQCIGVIHDEFFHHRGQLYAYLRALGKEPPMMWDFEHNAPEFKARQPLPA